MAVKLAHKRLAKPHHFIVAPAFGVEVGTAFAAAHRQCGERVFEYLFECQKFQHPQVYGRVKAQAAFIRADSRRHLHPVATVYLHLAVVVHPRHTEHNHPLRLHNPLQQAVAGVVAIGLQKRRQAVKYFFHRLMENRLAGIAALNGRQ